jgi:phage gp37-like protein
LEQILLSLDRASLCQIDAFLKTNTFFSLVKNVTQTEGFSLFSLQFIQNLLGDRKWLVLTHGLQPSAYSSSPNHFLRNWKMVRMIDCQLTFLIGAVVIAGRLES